MSTKDKLNKQNIINLLPHREPMLLIDELKDISFKIAVEDDGKSFFKLTIKVRNKIVADGYLKMIMTLQMLVNTLQPNNGTMLLIMGLQ